MIAADLEPMYREAAKAAQQAAAQRTNAAHNEKLPGGNTLVADLRQAVSPQPAASSGLISDADLDALNADAPKPKAEPAHKRKATAKAAKAVGASARGTQQAKALRRDAPDLAKDVRDGKVALDAADRERKRRNAAKPKPGMYGVVP